MYLSIHLYIYSSKTHTFSCNDSDTLGHHFLSSICVLFFFHGSLTEYCNLYNIFSFSHSLSLSLATPSLTLSISFSFPPYCISYFFLFSVYVSLTLSLSSSLSRWKFSSLLLIYVLDSVFLHLLFNALHFHYNFSKEFSNKYFLKRDFTIEKQIAQHFV